MFEQEINETIQRITRDVLQERTVVPLAEILEESRIPDRFKAFFETEARWWIYTESVARARDRRFDFSHPELGSLLTYLEQVQVRHARFERDDFIAVLDSAVKLTFNFLCRPQTTLKWYVFRGEPTKSIGETLLRMDAFVDFPYFRTVFGEWVERKKSERPTFDSISAKEFERIIRRIDDQILLSCTIDDLLDILTPLFDFIGKGEAQSLPIEGLIVFFDDKNIRKLVDFLERERGRRSHITPNSFVLLMEELLGSSDDEPETDFSSVYQDDALDEVVREHLGWGSGPVEEEDARRVARAAAESLNGGVVINAVQVSDDEEGLEDDRWEEEALLKREERERPDDASLYSDYTDGRDGHAPDEPENEPAADLPSEPHAGENTAAEREENEEENEEAAGAKILSAPGQTTQEMGEEEEDERGAEDDGDLFGERRTGSGSDPIFDLLIDSGDEEGMKSALKLSDGVIGVEEEESTAEDPASASVDPTPAAIPPLPGEFSIAALPEEEDLMEAILRDEEREPQEFDMETPLIFDAEEFGLDALKEGELSRAEANSEEEDSEKEDAQTEADVVEEERLEAETFRAVAVGEETVPQRIEEEWPDEAHAESDSAADEPTSAEEKTVEIGTETETEIEEIPAHDVFEQVTEEPQESEEEEPEVDEAPDATGEEEERAGEDEAQETGQEAPAEFSLVDEPALPTEEREADAVEAEEESREEREEEEDASAPESNDVRNYIDAMLERKVVKKIFNRNREGYEEMLNRLNDAETWREASRILDELFIRYDVDPYSRIAIRFTDCVYGRYLSSAHRG